MSVVVPFVAKDDTVDPRMDLLSAAIAFATEKHLSQSDLGGEPYILHPLRVMNDVWIKLGMSSPHVRYTAATAAVLHDVVEDSDATHEQIAKLFGVTTSLLVERLTRRPGEGYLTYIQRVNNNEIAKRIKRSDLIDNLDPRRIDLACSAGRNVQVSRYKSALALLR